jgi:hypothetical protein
MIAALTALCASCATIPVRTSPAPRDLALRLWSSQVGTCLDRPVLVAYQTGEIKACPGAAGCQEYDGRRYVLFVRTDRGAAQPAWRLLAHELAHWIGDCALGNADPGHTNHALFPWYEPGVGWHNDSLTDRLERALRPDLASTFLPWRELALIHWLIGVLPSALPARAVAQKPEFFLQL